MTIDVENSESILPIITAKTTVELKDYFCPFCNHKLFRGNVTGFNMVCSQCNKLVKSKEIPLREENKYPS